MSKHKLQSESLGLMRSTSEFYNRVVETTKSLDAASLGYPPAEAQRLEVQPTIFYRVNSELNAKYDALSNAFLEVQNDVLDEVHILFDEHETPPEDIDLLLDLTEKLQEHKATLEPRYMEGIYVDDKLDNVNNMSTAGDALVKSPGKKRVKSYAGDPFYALDQRLKAMIGDIRAIEDAHNAQGQLLSDKLEHMLVKKRRQGLFPRDYQRDVMPVLGEYIGEIFAKSTIETTDLQSAPWISDVMNALIEETGGIDDDVDKASNKERFSAFLDFIEYLLAEAQKTRRGWVVSWMGVSKQAQQALKDKLAGTAMGESTRSDLLKAIDKLAFDRDAVVEGKLKQAFDAFKARAIQEDWFVTPYCEAWNQARQRYKEIEGFIQSSITKRFNTSEALLESISKNHEAVFSQCFSGLHLKGDALKWLTAQGEKLKAIYIRESSNTVFKNAIVTYWESLYRNFWESMSLEIDQHYLAAKGSMISKSLPWKHLRKAASQARDALTNSKDMLFSYETVARHSVLSVFDRVLAKAYGSTINEMSEDRRTQLGDLRDRLEGAQSGAEASYYLQEAIFGIEADHASTSLAYNISFWGKPSRAVVALKEVRLECEDALFIPKSNQGLLVPVLMRAQELIKSYFSQFRVASLFERQYTKRLLDNILQQQERVRRSNHSHPYTIGDACHAISECVDSIYREVSQYNDSKIWTRLIKLLGGNADSQFMQFLKSFCSSLNSVQHRGDSHAYFQFNFFAATSQSIVIERLRRAMRLIEESDVSLLSKIFNKEDDQDKVLCEMRACIRAIENHRGDPKRVSLTLHGLHDYLERFGEGYAKTLKVELDWLIDKRHIKLRSEITGVSEKDADDGSVLSEYDKELRQKTADQEQAARALMSRTRRVLK